MMWYRVPTMLARIYPSTSDLCWRGCGQRGSFLHVWWDCPLIRPFWEEIKRNVKAILEIDLPLVPVHFLFHLPTILMAKYKKSALPHLLNAEKRLIQIHWKGTYVPNHGDWVRRVTDIMEAEQWIATCRNRRDHFEAVWEPWKTYIAGTQTVSPSLDMALLALVDPTFLQLAQTSRGP